MGEDIKLRRGLYMIFWGMSDASLVACLIASLYDPDFFLLLNRDWNIEKNWNFVGLQTYACKHIFKPVKLGLLLVYSYYQQALYKTTWLNPILYK